MSLNGTPSANRIHIGFFGRRNAGKSSVVNAVTGQNLAVVSDTKGTTTDPVYKSMELLPMGPVMIIDTPGYDDEGALGELRVKKTKQVLNKTDVAVLVCDASLEIGKCEKDLIALFKAREIPYVIVKNKSDLLGDDKQASEDEVFTSCKDKKGIFELKEKIAHKVDVVDEKCMIVGDIIKPSDLAVLVVPIDSAAPKGRLILPQQQVIRDVLEANATAIVVKENELKNTLSKLAVKPAIVITDSQAFESVSADTPKDIPLTSFSILMARFKGYLESAVRGVATLDKLENGDKILIAEGCTHHRQCDDIGSVKLPKWIKNYTGKDIQFQWVSGTEYPEDVSEYKLVVHCGGCMLTEKEVRYRIKSTEMQGVPATNYGVLIAYINGILERSLEVFPSILKELKK